MSTRAPLATPAALPPSFAPSRSLHALGILATALTLAAAAAAEAAAVCGTMGPNVVALATFVFGVAWSLAIRRYSRRDAKLLSLPMTLAAASAAGFVLDPGVRGLVYSALCNESSFELFVFAGILGALCCTPLIVATWMVFARSIFRFREGTTRTQFAADCSERTVTRRAGVCAFLALLMIAAQERAHVRMIKDQLVVLHLAFAAGLCAIVADLLTLSRERARQRLVGEARAGHERYAIEPRGFSRVLVLQRAPAQQDYRSAPTREDLIEIDIADDPRRAAP